MKDKIELRNNFLDNLKNPLSKMEGTFNFDIAATFGITAEEVYKELEFWEKQTFIDTATEDEYVDKHALMFGVKRRLGTKAKGIVKVTGRANSVIEENTIFLNRDGIKYKSLRKEYLNPSGVAEIEIECLSEGKLGNAAIGEITTFEIQNSNIYSVINEKEIINGYDKEPNSVLVARAKEKATRPAHSGNIYDYEQWAKQVDGVGKVLVKPLWNGNGTVKVLISNYNNDIADSSLIQKVRERIQRDDGRPVGADVTVDSFKAKTINIEVKIILKSGYVISDVKEKIESLLKAVIKTGSATFEKSNKTILSINRLEKSILEIDLVNDNFVKVNNSNSNIEIADDEILIVGTVIINEQ
ncbi:baseplate J/gp47 family protein [Fusobacterium nucleatum]|uniref:baseplate J/gp47 family protein n=1 Tax=Fusobacterium nucleatum TaxID=851 RepID=UPI0030D14BCB